jgi:hypothetical protein
VKSAILLAVLLLALPAAADLPSGKWSVARPIVLPSLTSPGLVYLPLDEEALTAASTSEYRIVQGGRIEVPYRELLEDGETQSDVVPHKITDWSEESDARGPLQAKITLDLGASLPPANKIRLALTSANFSAKLTIEQASAASGPGSAVKTGKVYRRGANFSKDYLEFPPTQQRYLRLLLRRDQGKLPRIDAITVLREFTIPRNLLPVPANVTRTEDYKHHRTILSFDPGRLSRDIVEAALEVKDPLFYRTVTIEVVSQGPPPGEKPIYGDTSWDALRRSNAGEPAKLNLLIPSARYIRFSIANGDDRPLSISSIKLFRLRRGLVFRADPAAQYQLWYGRPDASAPEYDLAKLPLTIPPTQLPIATLGAAKRLPTVTPTPPWSETHPAVFWMVLIGVVVLLVLIIVSAIRRTKLPAEPTQPS